MYQFFVLHSLSVNQILVDQILVGFFQVYVRCKEY